MKEYTEKRVNASRILDNDKVYRQQLPVSEILQTYKKGVTSSVIQCEEKEIYPIRKNNDFLRPVLQKKSWQDSGKEINKMPISPFPTEKLKVIEKNEETLENKIEKVIPSRIVFNGKTKEQITIPEKIQVIPAKIATSWVYGNKNNIEKGTRMEVVKEISKFIAELDPPAQPTICKKGCASNPGSIDPFVIKVKGQFDTHLIELSYRFSSDGYGYIITITEEGETFKMNENVGTEGGEEGLKHNEFASGHEVGYEESISELINGGMTNINAEDDWESAQEENKNKGFKEIEKPNITTVRKNKSRVLDAITKIGGEGSRWKCVRNHAGRLKNESKFFAFKDGKFIYITFKNLWQSWLKYFDMKFNIDDATVKEKMSLMDTKKEIELNEAYWLLNSYDYDLDLHRSIDDDDLKSYQPFFKNDIY